MDTLKELSNITKLSDYVTRVLGQNPGKFTLQGTNTYLIGRRPPFILVDTGEGLSEYPPLLEAALRSCGGEHTVEATGYLISDIVITHRHRDHFGGLPDVLAVLRKLHDESTGGAASESEYTRPRIHKYPSPAEPIDSEHENTLQSILSHLPIASYQSTPSGSPIHDLKGFQELRTQDGSATLVVLHTPGHTPDSICLLLRHDNDARGSPKVLFTADSVLGQGTAVFDDLSDYMQSLQNLLSWKDDPDVNLDFRTIYPGHGPIVDDGPELISTYIKHRVEREAQILSVLSQPPPQDSKNDDGPPSSWTIWEIVGQIYKDYPESLWLPAAFGVGLHLKKLERDGRAKFLGGDGISQKWVLLSGSKDSGSF